MQNLFPCFIVDFHDKTGGCTVLIVDRRGYICIQIALETQSAPPQLLARIRKAPLRLPPAFRLNLHRTLSAGFDPSLRYRLM